jgi:predicted 2-oxoglutarate/Fe(II)-dependent dioxygenase YbiX
MNLENFILHLGNGISPDLCDKIINKFKDSPDWETHKWAEYTSQPYSNDQKEFTVLDWAEDELSEEFANHLFKALTVYHQRLGLKNKSLANGISLPRLNRYQQGQYCRNHYDHIYSLFDGEKRGIPVLSVIANFNDDYQGGDLVFWDGTPAKTTFTLGKGDIIIWPSAFLYPHTISEITQGTRYSAVVWTW